MAQYAFFAQKADRWGKDMAPLWGNLNICPQLCQFKLPCHTQAELFSLNSLKFWGEGQKPCHNISFLLVWVENIMGDSHYGISVVWANPSQVRATSMEEVVKKLTACTASGTNWPYALAQLHKGTCHMPLPKEGHLGIRSQRGEEEGPCGQISQLEVCQLLVAGPQVIYHIGLNRHEEPVITSLPELLASSVSLTAGDPTYLGLIFTPSGGTGPKDTTSWWGLHHHGSQSHKSPLKLEGSMTTEVSNLLSQAMLETSSCGSKHSSPRRPAPVVVLTILCQKPEGSLWPADTSSQVSAEAAEASLEDIPPSISPIAAVSMTRSVTPLVDELEICANANKALEDFLTTKSSIDTHRWRAVWEQGVALPWSES